MGSWGYNPIEVISPHVSPVVAHLVVGGSMFVFAGLVHNSLRSTLWKSQAALLHRSDLAPRPR